MPIHVSSLAEGVIHKIDREVLDMAPVLVMVRRAGLTDVGTGLTGLVYRSDR